MLLKILFILMAVFFTWQLAVFLKHNPDALNENHLKKGTLVLGILALGLGLLIFLAWWLLKIL